MIPAHPAAAILLIPIFGLLAIGLVWTAMEPDDPGLSVSTAEETGSHSDTYTWWCVDGGFYRTRSLTLDITEEDFRKSMERPATRHGTAPRPAPTSLIEPENRYVLQIAEYLSGYAGEDPLKRAQFALWFVQTGFDYISDDDLYGQRRSEAHV